MKQDEAGGLHLRYLKVLLRRITDLSNTIFVPKLILFFITCCDLYYFEILSHNIIICREKEK